MTLRPRTKAKNYGSAFEAGLQMRPLPVMPEASVAGVLSSQKSHWMSNCPSAMVRLAWKSRTEVQHIINPGSGHVIAEADSNARRITKKKRCDVIQQQRLFTSVDESALKCN